MHSQSSDNERAAAAARYWEQLVERMQQETVASMTARSAEMATRAPAAVSTLARLMAEGLIVAASFDTRQKAFFMTVFEASRKLRKQDAREIRKLVQREGEAMGAIIGGIFSTDPLRRWQGSWIAYAIKNGLDEQVRHEIEQLGLQPTDFELPGGKR